MNIAAILGQAYSHDNASPMQAATLGRTRGYQEITGKRSSFSINVANTALVRVFAVIDPVSEQAQKWSSLIQVRFSSSSESKEPLNRLSFLFRWSPGWTTFRSSFNSTLRCS